MAHKNTEDRKAYVKKHYKENKVAILTRNKIYQDSNKEKIKKYMRDYEVINKQVLSNKHKIRYIKNRGIVLKKHKDKRQTLKKYIHKWKEVGCQICGYVDVDRPWRFDAHHADINNKSSVVSRANTMEALMRELSKCIVVCAMCHRDIHWGDDNGGE